MLTNQRSSPAPGHLVDLDVARDVAATREEAGVVAAGPAPSLAATAGTSRYSQICIEVPMARRSPRRARPIGAGKVRKWVLRWSPSSRTITSLPA